MKPSTPLVNEGIDPIGIIGDLDFQPTDSTDSCTEENDDELRPSERAASKGKTLPLSDRLEKDGPDCKGPGPGGAGAGGSPTRNSGGGPSNKTRKRKRGSEEGNEYRTTEGQNSAEFKVHLTHVHLAFNCKEEFLISPGFSKFLREPVKSSRDAVPSKIATTRQCPSVTSTAQIGGESSIPTAPPTLNQQTISGRGSLGKEEGSLPASQQIASTSSAGASSFSSFGISVLSSGGSSTPAAPSSSAPASPGVGRPPRKDIGDKNSAGVAATLAPEQQAIPTVVTHAGAILDIKIVANTSGVTTWGGNFILEGVNDAEGRAVQLRIVVKLSDWATDPDEEEDVTNEGEKLLKEAAVYDYLAEVAPGSTITPKYFGAFNCSGAIALILEDGGQRLSRDSFGTLDNAEKQKLFKMAEELHSYGVRHNDLSAHNILRNHDGTLAIIDFDCAELSHECQGPANCAELKDFAEVLKLSI